MFIKDSTIWSIGEPKKRDKYLLEHKRSTPFVDTGTAILAVLLAGIVFVGGVFYTVISDNIIALAIMAVVTFAGLLFVIFRWLEESYRNHLHRLLDDPSKVVSTKQNFNASSWWDEFEDPRWAALAYHDEFSDEFASQHSKSVDSFLQSAEVNNVLRHMQSEEPPPSESQSNRLKKRLLEMAEKAVNSMVELDESNRKHREGREAQAKELRQQRQDKYDQRVNSLTDGQNNQ